nr:uroporphyrinogen-III synthase [Methanolinea mesophila]
MKIAITRLEGKEGSDNARCAKFGFECYRVSPLRAEIQTQVIGEFVRRVNEEHYDCIFFTSALPARLVAPLLTRWPRIIAIGPQTAGTLEEYKIPCETLPSHYSRAFVPYLGSWIRGKKIGIPRADVPNPGLIEAIRDAGGIPEEMRCYALIPTEEPLDLRGADAVLFTSAMSFTRGVWEMRPGLLVMAIGEVTADAIRMGGIDPGITGDGTLEGTLSALQGYLQKKGHVKTPFQKR